MSTAVGDGRVGAAVVVVRRIVDEVSASGVSFLAAALAYYAFVSLIPLLVLAFVVATAVGGDALNARIATLAGEFLVPSGQGVVEEALGNQTGRGGVTVVGFVLVAWSALKVFRGIDKAFSAVYGTEGGSIVDQVRDGVTAIVAIGVGVFAVTAAGTVVAAVDVPGAGLVAPVVLLATLAVAFLPLYYVFPDADVTVREVLPGTVFAAVGWTILGAAFGVYAGISSQGDPSVYGVLGGILLLVTWFYFAGMLLLTGAVINAVLGGRSPDRSATDPIGRETDGQNGGADSEQEREDAVGG